MNIQRILGWVIIAFVSIAVCIAIVFMVIGERWNIATFVQGGIVIPIALYFGIKMVKNKENNTNG